MTPARTRLLLLGIDAASPVLLERWIADGTMPRLAELAARGLVGRTRGVDGFFVGSTWPSLYTGTTPARHGLHYLVQLVGGTYRLQRMVDRGAEFVRQPPFWRALTQAGQRVAVLDVPLSRLEPGLHGVQVVEWGGHDAIYGFGTWPAELAGELLRRAGRHPLGASCDGERQSAADYRRFVEQLEDGIAGKLAWTRDLLDRGGWDLFFQVFTEAHCAGHQCWHLHDPAHPAHDPAVVGELGDPLRRVYREIDRALGVLIDAAPGARVVVFAAHGMSHFYGAQFLLRDILLALGVATPLPVAGPSRMRAMAAGVWRRIPASLHGPLRAVRERLRDRTPSLDPVIPVDAAHSRCFPVNNGLAVGGIRLNLAGREPAGIVTPGDDAEAFIRRLTADLLDLVDDRTGAPVVRRVNRTADLYEGERRDDLPDLLVEWNDDVPTGSAALAGGTGARVSVRSARVGVISGINDYGRSGEHRPGGWFCAAGAEIPCGRMEGEISLLDLAPTFTEMLGVKLPGAEGRRAF